MRDTRFRAWEKNLKEMIPVDSINFEAGLINMELAWRTFEEIELMRYTGLKDSNGVEIYEEDVVKDGEDVYTIKYGRFIDTDVPTLMSQIGFYLLDKNTKETFPLYEIGYKLLGNTYENKDLLED